MILGLPREIHYHDSEVYPVKPFCIFCLTGAYFTGVAPEDGTGDLRAFAVHKEKVNVVNYVPQTI